MRESAGQGATEYLVLLAVVLVIALVGIALLGFFPGTASDAQIAESQIYWRSANPVSIVEASAFFYNQPAPNNMLYMRIRNSGSYPIRITGLMGAGGDRITKFWASGTCGTVAGYNNISDFYYLAPGEETYFNPQGYAASLCRKEVSFDTVTSSQSTLIANSLCQNSSASPGTLVAKNFGFEYVQYVEGQQITNRQIGKTFVVKCMPPL